jgi:para-nitrobenzyl esterase
MASALVGSPEAKGLFHKAILQSGAWMGLTMANMRTGASAQEAGAAAMERAGVATIAELRAKPTAEAGVVGGNGLVIDGYLIPEDLSITFAAGRQNDVDIIAGSNSDEGTFFGGGPQTVAGFTATVQRRFGDQADAFFTLYPMRTDADATAVSLASNADEISWNMRQAAAAQAKRGKQAYAYYFTRVPRQADGSPSPRGATHTAEIQYAFNNPTGLNWDDVDRKLADTMSSYWVNFATTGDPNGSGLPAWPALRDLSSRALVLGDTVQAETAAPTAKLTFYDAAYQRQMKAAGTN